MQKLALLYKESWQGCSDRGTLNCTDYLRNYLSAHADYELTGKERRLADEHISRCASCHLKRLEQLAIKTIIRCRFGIIPTPADVSIRIRSELATCAGDKFADCLHTLSSRAGTKFLAE